MFPKRLLALTLFAALAVMPPCVLRAQWVQTNGPGGGRVNCLLEIGPYLFCGTYTGVFVSTDHGAYWTPMINGLTNVKVQSLAGDGTAFFAATSGGVFRSSDTGKTWATMNDGLTTTDVRSLYVSGTFIFVGTSNGIFYSSNNGEGWVSASGIPNSTIITAFASLGTKLFAGSSLGMFCSTDNGVTWIASNTGITNFDIRSVVAVSYYQVYHDLFAGSFGGGIFRSTDTGKTWKACNNGLTEMDVRCFGGVGNALFAGAGNKVFRLIADTAWGESDNDLLYSTSTWVSAFTIVRDSFTSKDDIVYAATTNGVRLSTDYGDSWPTQPGNASGLHDPAAIATIGSTIFAAGDSIFYSTDNGTSWRDSRVVSAPSCFSVHDSELIVGTYRDQIARSEDSGVTWTFDTPPSSAYEYKVNAFQRMGGITFAATDGLLYYCFDGFHAWGLVQQLYEEILSFAVIDTVLFAYGFDGVERNSSPMTNYGVDDGGTSWTDVGKGLDDLEDNIQLVSIGKTLFAGSLSLDSLHSVFRSTDYGATWEPASTGLPGTFAVTCFVVSGNNLLAGSFFNGVYLSTDLGDSWHNVSDGLDSSSVGTLAVNETTAFAGTEYGGVYRRPLEEMISAPSIVSPKLPEACEIIQIYPNPFTQSTQITITSQSAGYAEVSIVNMLGVEVARLFSGELGAGEHSFSWGNPTGLPDGGYECLVRMNGQVQTLPVVLMR